MLILKVLLVTGGVYGSIYLSNKYMRKSSDMLNEDMTEGFIGSNKYVTFGLLGVICVSVIVMIYMLNRRRITLHTTF